VVDGGDVVTGFVVTGFVVTGVVTIGAGTGIGGTGSERGVLTGVTGVVVWPCEEDWPDDWPEEDWPEEDELPPLDPDPDWSWPFVWLNPGVAVWLSGAETVVWPLSVTPVPDDSPCVFVTGPAVSP